MSADAGRVILVSYVWHDLAGGGSDATRSSATREVRVTTTSDVRYDPYDVEIHRDPYPVFRRLREEAPLYYNDEHDFYALSRFDDVEPALGRPEHLHLGAGRRSSS